ncbi:MAG: putative transposase [Rhodothermales bacterium]|jgi:putative transposase
MVKMYGRKTSDIAWGEFVKTLEYVCLKRGVVLRKVNPAYTSQTCSLCGHCDKQNRKSQAEFVCTSCGHEQHADVNAAINILGRAFPSFVDRKGSSACRLMEESSRFSAGSMSTRPLAYPGAA